jgi:WD40 repeat protein
VATGGQSNGRGEVKVWDGDGRLLLGASDHPSDVESVGFSPDGKWLLSGDTSGILKVRNAETGTVLWETTRGAPSTSATFSPDGQRVAAAGVPNAQVWDARTGTEVYTLRGSPTGFHCVRFNPDGQRLITCGDGIILWDMSTGQQALTLRSRCREAQFSADGSRIFSAGFDTSVGATQLMIWEAGPSAGP